MTYPASPDDPAVSRVRPDAAQFWAGAAATAVVAALIALVGILVCRWTLSIPILAPEGDGAWGNAHTGEYALLAALIAVVAAGVLYLLVLGTPQPRLFFNWIMGLLTAVATVYPFSTSAPLNQKGATALVNLVIGLAITSLLTAVAARSVRRTTVRRAPRGYVEPPAYRDDAAYRGNARYQENPGMRKNPGYQDGGTYGDDGSGFDRDSSYRTGATYPAEAGYGPGPEQGPGYGPGQLPPEPTQPIGLPRTRGRRRR
ncbi:MAG TPA: DUF6069 family protein [Trebonia sp.]